MMKELKETTSVPYFDLIEKRLKENNGGSGFYVGDKVCAFLAFNACVAVVK